MGAIAVSDDDKALGELMTPDLLRMAGEAIFGPQWQAPMARALNMTTRHMSRMLNPALKDRPTERLRPILIGMLRAKSAEVSTALHMLQTTDAEGHPLVPGGPSYTPSTAPKRRGRKAE